MYKKNCQLPSSPDVGYRSNINYKEFDQTIYLFLFGALSKGLTPQRNTYTNPQ